MNLMCSLLSHCVCVCVCRGGKEDDSQWTNKQRMKPWEKKENMFLGSLCFHWVVMTIRCIPLTPIDPMECRSQGGIHHYLLRYFESLRENYGEHGNMVYK